MSKMYYAAEDVAEMLGISKGHAYKIIQSLNDELKKKHYLVVAGKVPKKYFAERYYGGVEEVEGDVN